MIAIDTKLCDMLQNHMSYHGVQLCLQVAAVE